MQEVRNHKEFIELSKNNDKAFLFLYKKEGSEQSSCAYDKISNALTDKKDIVFFMADVTNVRDIHGIYGITTVPTLLEFKNGKLANVYKGCLDEKFYNNIFTGTSATAYQSGDGGEVQQKSVTVYSTPTCSWCNTLKSYLRDHKIKFRDIDVSRDMKAAEDMVKRSGQQGVPQTLINGEVIIGFDKARIDKLLGIQSK